VGAGPFSMEYYMRHTFEASKNSMTFQLDYERCSDFADTVGYWHVEDLGDGWCRIYYSTDSQLPNWVPGWAKDNLMKLALRRSTGWVDEQCKIAAGTSKAKGAPPPVLRAIERAAIAALAWKLALARKSALRQRLASLMSRLA